MDRIRAHSALSPQEVDSDKVFAAQSKSGNSAGLEAQHKIVQAVFDELDIMMTAANTILIHGKSGESNRLLPFVKKKPSGSLFIVSNLDRAIKTLNLAKVTELHQTLVQRKSIIVTQDKELKELKEILKVIHSDKSVSAIERFIASRFTQSINRDASTRRGLPEVIATFLGLLLENLNKASEEELKVLTLAAGLGAITNAYLTKTTGLGEALRLPQTSFREAQVVRSIKANHPDWTHEQIRNWANKGKYGQNLSNAKSVGRILSSLRNSKLDDYETGNFETEVQAIFEGLEPFYAETVPSGLAPKYQIQLRHKLKGFTGLRPFQKEAHEHLRYATNVVVQVAAGGGKSLLFTIPAMRGLKVLIISPYLRLIHNQVKSARRLLGREEVHSLTGDVKGDDKIRLAERFAASEGGVLFATPDQIKPDSEFGPQIIQALSGKVDLLTLDEAHHVKLDGTTFRLAYHHANLNWAWREIGRPQLLALSASLSEQSRLTLSRVIDGQEFETVRSSLLRPNVSLQTRHFHGANAQEEKMAWLCLMVCYLKEVLGVAKVIVYVSRPARVVQMMNELKSSGFRKVYGVHGKNAKNGLTNEEMENNQAAFEEGASGVMIATSTYAEGIDVEAQAVIVADLPINVETLYQMLLRSGHQGQPGLGFICWDQKAIDFNTVALLKNDPVAVELYLREMSFLKESDQLSDKLWDGLVRKFE